MTRTLLIIVAVGAILFVVCFSIVHALGGLKPHFHVHDDFAEDGPAVSRDLPWSGGDALHIDVPATITYTQGPQAKFTVTAPRSVLDRLTFEDGELTESRHRWRFGHGDRLTIAVTSPGTHAFYLAGAQKLTLSQYDQDSLDLEISGAAQVTGQGRAKRLDAHISGAGDLDLGQLPVDDAVVSIAGAGDATVDPKRSVDVSISGAGHVNLKTRPPQYHASISGFGAVDYP